MSTVRRDFLGCAFAAVVARTALPLAAKAEARHHGALYQPGGEACGVGISHTAEALDAKLIHLGNLLDLAWSRECEAWLLAELEGSDDAPNFIRASALSEATHAVMRQIEREPAKTLEGVLVKMRAFCCCNEDEPISAKMVLPSYSLPEPATSERLMVSVLVDLQTIGGMPR